MWGSAAVNLRSACLLLLLGTGPALADAAPDPDEVADWFRPRIEGAGYRCPDPVTMESPTPADQAYARKRNVGAWRIRCGDGQVYLLPRGRWGQRNNPPPRWVVPVR